MVWPRWKQVLALLPFIGFVSLILVASSTYIQELPLYEQATTWRWFWVGWGAGTVGAGLSFLPRWLSNRVVTGNPEEVATWKKRYGMLPGICIVAGALGGITYPGDLTIRLALGSLVGGAGTALIFLFTALITTKKGRAMTDKAAAEYNEAPRGQSS